LRRAQRRENFGMQHHARAPRPSGSRQFAILSEGDDLVLRPTGVLDAGSVPELRARLTVLCRLAADGRLIIDLTDTTRVDPPALQSLRRASVACRERGVPLVVRDPAHALRASEAGVAGAADLSSLSAVS
jgi:anti-anti-sigma regulatory factor